MDTSTTSSSRPDKAGTSSADAPKENVIQGKNSPPMVPVQQQPEMPQRRPSSTSTVPGTSFHPAPSNGVGHHGHPQPGPGPVSNHHMAPHYRNGANISSRYPHGHTHSNMYNGEPMMGAIRGQGRPHIPEHHMQPSSYHQPGMNRAGGRFQSHYPVQNNDMYGQNGYGRPGPVRNIHHRQLQQPHYHSFAPVGPLQQGMGRHNISRGPSPNHQQQQPSMQRNPPPQFSSGQVAASTNTDASNHVAANENQAVPQDNQQPGPGQSSYLPQSRQQVVIHEQHRHHNGMSAMHQGYPNHHCNNQYHDQDRAPYGSQHYSHNGGHYNTMPPDMSHYNYHHPSHGSAGQGGLQGHNHFHGHPDSVMSGGYAGTMGRHETYTRGPNPNFHPQQHLSRQSQNYGSHNPPSSQQTPTHGFQLPKYNPGKGPSEGEKTEVDSSQTTSRSPSPPPAPSAQAYLRAKLREQSAKKAKEGSEPSLQSKVDAAIQGQKDPTTENTPKSCRNTSRPPSSSIKPTALEDRGNVTVVSTETSNMKKPIADSVTKASKQEDITADAASILLQLGSVMNRSAGGSENQNPRNSGQSSPPIPSSVQHSTSMDDVSEAGTMLTMQTEIPDLTSGPSSDSIESELKPITSVKQESDSDFPCAVPDRYPTRLALPNDNAKLNNLHCFLRSELLEIFVVSKSNKKSPCHSPSSSVGRVGLRCVHCAMSRMSCADAPMSVFYPKSIAEIYRLVTSWQRCHLRKCKKIPPAARSKWEELRNNDKSRGKTHYWVTSAKQIGLMDCQSRAGGIRFAPDFDPTKLPCNTILKYATKEAAEAAEKAAAIAAKAQKIVSIATAAAAASNMAIRSEDIEMAEAPKLNGTQIVNSTAIRT